MKLRDFESSIPATTSIRVVYTHQGTTYGAIIANPRTYPGILTAINKTNNRKIGVSQIVRLESISPQIPTHQRRH